MDQRDARGGEGADGPSRGRIARDERKTRAQPRVERDETAVSAVSGPTDRLIDRLMLGKGEKAPPALSAADHRQRLIPRSRTDPRASFQSDPTWPPSVSSRAPAAQRRAPQPLRVQACRQGVHRRSRRVRPASMPEGTPTRSTSGAARSPSPSPRARPRCLAIPVRSRANSRCRSTGAARPARRRPPALARDQSPTAGTLESAKPRSVAHLTFPPSALRRCSTPPACPRT